MISSAFLLALGAASAVSAIPLSPMKYDTLAALEKRIVISPEIQTPNADTVWTAGQEATASWETDLLEEYPEAGDSGRLVLGYIVEGDDSYHLDYYNPIANDFSLRAGNVTFTLPADTPARDNAIAVLFGDSGNRSEKFTIKAAASADSLTASDAVSEAI